MDTISAPGTAPGNGAPAPETPPEVEDRTTPHPNELLDAVSTVGMDVEIVAIRLDTVVTTLQWVIEHIENRDTMLVDVLAGQRDTIAEQGDKLRKFQHKLWTARAPAPATLETKAGAAPGDGAPEARVRRPTADRPIGPPADARAAEKRNGEYDEVIIELANDWDTTAAHYRLLVAGGEYDTYQRQLAAIEGKLLHCDPRTLLGVQRILFIAHRIAGERESDNDGWLGEGPAAGLIARALKGLEFLS